MLTERGLKATLVEGHGDPARAIVEAASDGEADLVIVGTRGQGALARAVLGSVSSKVVHDAPCDVMVVR
jgi:nucleotide-binding universal stress UspA family protein